MAVADDELHAGATRGRDDCRAVIKCERDRLFDQQMFAVARRERRMLRVKLMRCRHIDHIDRGIGAQLPYGLVAFAAEVCSKSLSRLRAPIGRRNQRNARITRKCRQHYAKCTAQAGHPEAELAVIGRAHRAVYLDKAGRIL